MNSSIEKVKNLEKQGIISGFRSFFNSENYGYKAFFLLLTFKSYGLEVEKNLSHYALSTKSITQSLKLFGKWSMMFLLRAKNQEEVQEIIITMRNKHPEIGDYEIIPIFKDLAINHLPAEF